MELRNDDTSGETVSTPEPKRCGSLVVQAAYPPFRLGRYAAGRSLNGSGHARNGSAPYAAADASRARLNFDGVFCGPDWRRYAADQNVRDLEIRHGSSGPVIWEQKGVIAPRAWTDQAVRVVASKYFYGDASRGNDPRTGGKEQSVFDLVSRVTWTIGDWALEDGYVEAGSPFPDELEALCVMQYAAFNSPVWFNVGLSRSYGVRGGPHGYRWDRETSGVVPNADAYEYAQASACFIQSVRDDMADIMRLATSEAMLFKLGSGTGTDLSTLRSSREKLAGGGKPSGPVSFMRIYDAIASVIKSGGKTRRAAKMQTMKVWHPDVREFIWCKALEERKAKTLVAAGYSDDRGCPHLGRPGRTP
jgi:ribonucleoside-diphosphate reductase alpha chain